MEGGENHMLYMTMPEFAFFMGLTSYVIRDVFSKRHVFNGSKRLHIIGSIVIGLLLFLLYLHDEMNLNDLKILMIYVLFVGMDFYKMQNHHSITEHFLWLSSRQENMVLKVCGTSIVIPLLALLVMIKFI